MIGQYATAAPVGKLLDRYGPRICSLLASILFAFGYGMFALRFASTLEGSAATPVSTFPQLVVYFGVLGVALVLSYVAAFPGDTSPQSDIVGTATSQCFSPRQGYSLNSSGLRPAPASLSSACHPSSCRGSPPTFSRPLRACWT